MNEVTLRELCNEYVNWYFMSLDAGGYQADSNRAMVHEKIVEELQCNHSIDYILHHLDKWIDIPLKAPQTNALWKTAVSSYGLALYRTLLIPPDPIILKRWGINENVKGYRESVAQNENNHDEGESQ